MFFSDETLRMKRSASPGKGLRATEYEQHLFTLEKGRAFAAIRRVVSNSSLPESFLAAPQIHSSVDDNEHLHRPHR